MSSFRMGSRPEWCTPIPRCSIGSILLMAGSSRSSPLRHCMALLYTWETKCVEV